MKLSTVEEDKEKTRELLRKEGMGLDSMEEWKAQLALGLRRWKVDFYFRSTGGCTPGLLVPFGDDRLGRILAAWKRVIFFGDVDPIASQVQYVDWRPNPEEEGWSLEPAGRYPLELLEENLEALGVWLQGAPDDYDWPEGVGLE